MKDTMDWLLEQFPDLHMTIEDIVSSADRVVVRVRSSGTNLEKLNGVIPPSGKPFTAEQTHWLRLVDGQIREHWATRDDLTVMLQLGVIARPSRGGV